MSKRSAARGVVGIGGVVAAAIMGGCHLLIGYKDGVLAEEDAGTACPPDGVRNGAETGVDCGGGSCPACADGEGCVVGTDCASLVCQGGTCRPAACTDGVQNGEEIDVDCGGPASGCAGCANGRRCEVGPDCESGVCKGGECVSFHLWSKAFPSTGTIQSRDVVVDAAGDIVFAFAMAGEVDFGEGQLTLPGGTNMGLAGFSPMGVHLWSTWSGDKDDFDRLTITGNSMGDMVAVGELNGTMDFGVGALTSAGQADILVAAFDGGGPDNAVWSKRFGDGEQQIASDVAVDFDGNVVVTGVFAGSVDFGGGAMESSPPFSFDHFLTKFSSSGDHLWSMRFGSARYDDIASGGVIDLTATDQVGNIFVVGHFVDAVDFGRVLTAQGSEDVFMATLDPSGGLIWAKQVMPVMSGYVELCGAALSGAGDAVLAGSFGGVVDFGGGPMEAAGAADIFVVRYDAAGSHLWTKRFGEAAETYTVRIAMDVAGSILVAGTFEGTIDFGGGPLISTDGENLYLAKLDASGNHVWSRRFDGGGQQALTHVATGGPEDVVIAGDFMGTLDLGGEVLEASSTSSFLARLRLP